MNNVNIPDLGLPGERPGRGGVRKEIPCKNGTINIYRTRPASDFIVFFPTFLADGQRMITLSTALDVQMLIMDYLSKEAGRSETKQVHFPDYPGR